VTLLFQAIPRERGTDHLVIVYAGYPVPDAVKGLDWELRRDASIVRNGQTDGRGQFWLKRLPQGAYSLTVRPANSRFRIAHPDLALTPREPIDLIPRRFAALVSPKPEEWRDCKVGRWCCWQTADIGHELMRLLELDVPRAKAPIVRFTIFRDDDSKSRVARGLVGLYKHEGRWRGEAVLDLFPDEGLSAEIDNLNIGDFEFVTDIQSVTPEEFKVAIDATLQPQCKEVLVQAAKRRKRS
jgi:hypothetical protein